MVLNSTKMNKKLGKGNLLFVYMAFQYLAGKLTKYGDVYEELFLANEYIGAASEDDIPL